MSWSINLSGKHKDVEAELEAAQNVISDALNTIRGLDNEKVSVSVNGHGYTNDDGSCTFSASYSVSGIANETPAPEIEAAPA